MNGAGSIRIGRGLAFLGPLALIACQTRSPQDEGESRSPNLILVLVDDLGWKDLGCYGSDFVETPQLDRLAAEGLRFTQAYAASAVCSPTRAALLTGKHPARLGITDWIHHAGAEAKEAMAAGRNLEGYSRGGKRPLLTPRNKVWLEAEELTLAEYLAERGYRTAHIGKWHLGPAGHSPLENGFDINLGGFQMGSPPSYFDPYAGRGWDGIPQLAPRREGEYLTDREADEAVRFIEDNADRPFFLYLAHYAVHSPIQAKPEWIEHYENKPRGRDRHHAPYAAMVHSVDQAMGRILTTLERLELREDTLIVFTSDNGGASHFPATDNTPLRKGKGFPYEGGLRIPLIVSFPGQLPAGQLRTTPTVSMDVFPTVVTALFGSYAARPESDGIDLWPGMMRREQAPPRSLIWHFPHYWWGGRVQPYSVIREGDWKLIRHDQDDRIELFHLTNDPSEAHDRFSDEPDRAAAMQQRLQAELDRLGAKRTRRNPDYRAPDA